MKLILASPKRDPLKFDISTPSDMSKLETFKQIIKNECYFPEFSLDADSVAFVFRDESELLLARAVWKLIK